MSIRPCGTIGRIRIVTGEVPHRTCQAGIFDGPVKGLWNYSGAGVCMRLKGKIKKIDPDRGNGFILAADGREFFFHRSHLEGLEFRKMAPGDDVELEFDEFRGPTTPKALVATVVRNPRRPAD